MSSPFAGGIDLLSFCVTPIELISESDVDCGHATGFFWWTPDTRYLITNWHNVSGLHPFDFRPMHDKGFIPKRLRVYRSKSSDDSNNVCMREPFEIELYSDFVHPKWLQHPQFEEKRIDVVAIDVGASVEERFCLNKYGFEELWSYVGETLYIVGYPFRNYEGFMLPIWKRASFATEPMIPVDGRPMYLVDAATRFGMSGSPVIRRVFGPAPLRDGSTKLDAWVASEFAGVYSGRLDAKLDEIAIGLVWYPHLVNEIIVSQQQGRRFWPCSS
ncbi:MAG: hypothetical protein WD852_09910 [Methyloceanibacter sp.]